LRQFVLAAAGRIRKSSTAIAEIDLLANFAHISSLRNYVRPQLDERNAFWKQLAVATRSSSA
jgi:DNA mismatch repair protein MutS